jgi:hypothetical protein
VEPLVNFAENIAANPVEHSKEQLYRFLNANGENISLTEDGMIVAYKGMQRRQDENGEDFFVPSNHGRGNHVIINGVDYPDSTSDDAKQRPGDVIELPRSEVVHNPGVSCSVGLHISNFNYARSYGEVVEVLVNPRDVVSVPNNENDKVRACRYTVIGPASKPRGVALIRDEQPVATQAEVNEAIKESFETPVERRQDGSKDFAEKFPYANERKDAKPKSDRPRYPSPAAWDEMVARAKKRKQSLLKYATAQGPWKFFGDDPKNRKHWDTRKDA